MKGKLIRDMCLSMCENCEIAIWDKGGEFVTNRFINCEGDDVKGYLSTDEVADIIYKVKNY